MKRNRLLSLMTMLALVVGTVAFLWAPTVPTQAVVNHLVINEVYYNSSEDPEADEFIEIYNPTDFDVDVSNWILEEYTATAGVGSRWTFPAVTLDNNKVLVVFRDGGIGATSFASTLSGNRLDEVLATTNNQSGQLAMEHDEATGAFALHNTADKVILKDDTGNTVDVAVWGDQTHADHVAMDLVEAGKSMQRDWTVSQDDTNNCSLDFHETTPNPGQTIGEATITIPAPGFEMIAILGIVGLGVLLAKRRKK
ncbi:MAG: lamin tail domain-containing protein [Candidatus Hermodarchaeota archaeon]